MYRAEVIDVYAAHYEKTSVSTSKAGTNNWTAEYYGSAEVTGATVDELNELKCRF